MSKRPTNSSLPRPRPTGRTPTDSSTAETVTQKIISDRTQIMICPRLQFPLQTVIVLERVAFLLVAAIPILQMRSNNSRRVASSHHYIQQQQHIMLLDKNTARTAQTICCFKMRFLAPGPPKSHTMNSTGLPRSSRPQAMAPSILLSKMANRCPVLLNRCKISYL